ncbi:hypothetical protein SEA_NANOSMITE_122 [Mycobacterium phage Nanosmite]|nr:hypothetical protein SEA_NANOSMITE_122 [Mycobacterium phage Nanosmite]
MSLTFDAHVIKLPDNGELWVQSLSTGDFEIGVQHSRDEYAYRQVSREALEQFSTNILAALMETV